MDSPVVHEVPVRYRDFDTYGHVNNAVYGTYCEEARVAYVQEVLGVDDVDDLSIVLVSFSIDYRAPANERGPVEVAVEVTGIGESSFTMAYELRQSGDVVAEAESTQVHIDMETRQSRPLPDDWRERVAAFEDL